MRRDPPPWSCIWIFWAPFQKLRTTAVWRIWATWRRANLIRPSSTPSETSKLVQKHDYEIIDGLLPVWLSDIDQHWSTPEVRSQLIAADMPFHNIVLNDGNKVRGLLFTVTYWYYGILKNPSRSQPLPLELGARNSKAKISTNTSNWL